MKRFSDKSGRRAFTLVELIVVIGLMAMLGTVSVAGYSAASQGMKNRAVVQDVVSFLRQAMQTALIDNTPTAVLFYNRALVKGEATGFAVAIKQTGRVTMIKTPRGELFVDEFADWHQSFSASGTSRLKAGGSRVYRMQEASQLKAGRDQCSSVLNNYLTAVQMDDYMIQADRKINDWVTDSAHNLTAGENNKRALTENTDYANNYLWGRGFAQGGNNLRWKPGDAYGVEFAQVQLPDGYIFGTTTPSKTGESPASGVSAVLFYPADARSDGTINMSQNVTVSRSGGTQQWKIDNSMLKD